MTATPIPRSLGQLLHGDLSLSLLDERPPGRRPVATKVIHVSSSTPDRIAAAADAEIRDVVAAGGRAYLVCTRVTSGGGKDGERGGKLTAEALHARLTGPGRPLGGARVELVHGRMSSKDKEEALRRFRKGECEVLVASVVVEVGVDVPEASLMVVFDAENLGLAALHQLRGRVGRGEAGGRCLLVTGAEGTDQRRRLGVMEETDDGFLIAEADLVARGPGEVLGVQQSGVSGDWKVARLPADADVLVEADEAAEMVVSEASARRTGGGLERLDAWQMWWEETMALVFCAVDFVGGSEASTVWGGLPCLAPPTEAECFVRPAA